MARQATSAFTIDHRDYTPIHGVGGTLTHARWSKTFSGELTGTSVVEMILLGTAGSGPAVYVGMERFDCDLAGRVGSFLLVHSATMLGQTHEGSWKIAPGSGTDDLAGISGYGVITAEHDFVLHYDVEPDPVPHPP
jgi:hypothetical protein